MTFLERIVHALERRKVAFAVAGGYAVTLHGAVRGTVDVDLVIRLKKADFIAVEDAFKAMGLAPRLPVSAEEVFEFREEYVERRNLIAWSFVNPEYPVEVVDILLTEDLNANRVVRIRANALQIPVVGLDDLIRMKKSAGRPQDKEDVRALERIRKAKA